MSELDFQSYHQKGWRESQSSQMALKAKDDSPRSSTCSSSFRSVLPGPLHRFHKTDRQTTSVLYMQVIHQYLETLNHQLRSITFDEDVLDEFESLKDLLRQELKGARRSLNVNEEYLGALRTKSYADFFTKAQSLVQQPSSPSNRCHVKFSEVLLEPGQDTIADVLESAFLSKKPDLKGLIHDYFDLSAEASKICSRLLKSIGQLQANYRFVQGVLDITTDNRDSHSPDGSESMISQLNSFIALSNPFSSLDSDDFEQIRDKYSSVLQHLKSKRKSVARKIKLIRCLKKVSEVFVTVSFGLVAVTAMVIAAHTLTALLMGPAIFSFPVKRMKRKLLDARFLRSGMLRKVGQQLDVAAKGTYILNRDFDTMSRLVARLHDEVEHSKAMIQFCLERREHKFLLQEVVKELRKGDVGFRMQVEELEEHVYLCLVTINRARALVIKEICVQNSMQHL